MKINREMSHRTWEKIDAAVLRICQRARASKDNETVKDTDLIMALLRNLANELQIEDDKAAA